MERYLKFAWWAVGIGVALPVFVGLVGSLYYPDGLDNVAEFGDLVAGTAGPVLALAGLLFVYVAFLGQRQELALQRKDLRLARAEMELTRKELKGQRKALAEQAATMRRQAFESTFFQLLGALRDSVSGATFTRTESGPSPGVRTTYQEAHTEYRGAELFKRVAVELANGLERSRPAVESFIQEKQKIGEDVGMREALADSLSGTYRQVVLEGASESVGILYRQLRGLLGYLDAADDPQRYAAIVADQLTESQLVLIWYHVRTGSADERLAELVDRYGILDRVTPDDLQHPGHATILGAGTA